MKYYLKIKYYFTIIEPKDKKTNMSEYSPEPLSRRYEHLNSNQKHSHTCYMKARGKYEDQHAVYAKAGKLPYLDMQNLEYFTDLKVEEIVFLRSYLTEIKILAEKRDHLIRLGILEPLEDTPVTPRCLGYCRLSTNDKIREILKSQLSSDIPLESIDRLDGGWT